ncbi:hypothetical protein BSKO_06163 [Bryopsis sp. KO-2023]|nr:hypothetical protein BSKO_06163 [Bryopsis sp. KO-2023]
MHSKGIVHRDLKLKNILMHNGSVKLSDFGLSQVLMDDDQVRFACGTIDHMAPELFKSPDERHNGKAADVYSLGVLLYSILVGAPPILIPEKLSQSEQISFIQTKLDKTQIIIPEYSGPFHNNSKDDGCQMKFRLTDDVKHLLASMLNKNPQSRITMEGIKAHNWMHMHLPYIMYCQSACGLTTNLRGSC